jgi:hypothetical protein
MKIYRDLFIFLLSCSTNVKGESLYINRDSIWPVRDIVITGVGDILYK